MALSSPLDCLVLTAPFKVEYIEHDAVVRTSTTQVSILETLISRFDGFRNKICLF
jgi:hypothetical protein